MALYYHRDVAIASLYMALNGIHDPQILLMICLTRVVVHLGLDKGLGLIQL